jgi:hypothetical protein
LSEASGALNVSSRISRTDLHRKNAPCIPSQIQSRCEQVERVAKRQRADDSATLGTRYSWLVSKPSVNLKGRRQTAVVVACFLLVAAASYILWRAVWPSPPNLIDQCDNKNFSRDSAPIVVVGVLASDTLIRKPVPMRSDPKYPLQLRKLTVQVENVLKGTPIPKKIAVYYFTWAGGFSGPQPLGLWKVGGRRILWLRRDSGVLRTACDGWDGCTMSVQSGAHLNYRPDPEKPIEYALADLLLTRGEGPVDNTGFASEIKKGVPDQGLQGYVVEKLRRLASSENRDIKSSACKLLWIYTADRFAPSIRQEAEHGLQTASCQCATTLHGNVECQ